MEIRALTWNVYHGRDFPPDPALRTKRSRFLRLTERSETHAQVNQNLSRYFHALIAGAAWDVALLQEFPPRWAERLAERCEAKGHLALTSRNSCAPLRRLGAMINPDLIGSNEGGSNFVLVRSTLGLIVERRELAVCPGPKPERRMLSFARTESGLCIANAHLSTGSIRRERAEDEFRLAAERATHWADGSPLILGGDLNLRPGDSEIYDELRERFGLAAPTADDCLDHLLVSGIETLEAPTRWAAERREVIRKDGRRIRLSDHAPVEAVFRV